MPAHRITLRCSSVWILIGLVAFVWGLPSWGLNLENTSRSECLTNGCKLAAQQIRANMDPSVDPCEDFYEFACGGYLANVRIPADRTMTNQITEVTDNLNHQLRKILEEEYTEEDSRTTQIMKKFYSNCMDTDRIEDHGLTPLHNILVKLGGWPVIQGNDWDDTDYDWMESLLKIKELGYTTDILFEFMVFPDMKNSTQNMIRIRQPTLPLSRNAFIKGFANHEIQAYYKYQVALAELLGADIRNTAKEMKENVKFETQIAKITLHRSQSRNYIKLYNKISIRELEELTPGTNWLGFVNKMLSPFYTVSSKEPIVLLCTEYLIKLIKLLNNTPNKTIANYLLWQVVRNSVSSLNHAATDLALDFEKSIIGRKKEVPRWKRCITSLVEKGGLAIAVGSKYVQQFFDINSKRVAEEMFSYIKSAFSDLLLNLPWMDKSTKVKGILKSHAIVQKIAYPQEILNNTIVEEYYKNLILSDGNFLDQKRNISRFALNNNIQTLRETLHKSDWKSYAEAAVANAFYNRITNSLHLPSGILHGIFFNAERPMYLNYGSIGFIIGHEITHGFDDAGRKFDIDGNMRDWWDKNTNKNFLDRVICMIKQYNNFVDPEVGMHINGKLTLGENIADTAGIKQAYLGYQKWVDDHGAEPILPHLPFTSNQLFWISRANLACGKLVPQVHKKRILSDKHPPSRFRVNGPYGNVKEFSKDWNCPLGSKMNPVLKCEVW